ncbi:F0F1 ATP synthase subunit A [Phaeospirillum tilakii]|uniref:ATP synthase subunit a n=1 Tax=Phaeospirillum tilakii TaxID=741673 RepID=A0ABW5CES2_9PROT
MIESSPFAPQVLFQLGPLAVSRAVVTTWVLIAALGLVLARATRTLSDPPGRGQAVLELLVEGIAGQIEEVMRTPPRPFLPLLGSLFLFVLVANLSALLPGVQAPTARIETTAALTLVVFAATHLYGVRARGVRRYLAHYLEPTPLMLPLTVLSEITRTFSMMIRLFGNVMSHEMVLAVLLSLAGLLLPVPVMALGLLIGAIQAYIFAILATVFVGAAIGAVETG